MGAILMLCTNSAAAADGNTVHIRGQGCAEVSDDSLRSSARIKATDKAAFAAVSNLERLAPYKAQLDPHDFNVLVYTIVDEYLEDTDIKSTSEGDEVCAQMEGYVSLQNIDKAVDDTLMRLSQEEQLPDEMPEKAAELSAEISEELDKIQQQQQAEQLAELEDKEVLFQGEAPKASGTVVKVEDEVEAGNEIFETPVITPPQAQQPATIPENNTINTHEYYKIKFNPKHEDFDKLVKEIDETTDTDVVAQLDDVSIDLFGDIALSGAVSAMMISLAYLFEKALSEEKKE